MEKPAHHSFSPWFLAWILVFAAGAVLLLAGNGHEALWYDEAYTMAVSTWDAPDIVDLIAKDSHPPLYFLLLKDFTLVFGNTPEAARAFSALGLLLLAGLGFFPLRRWWGEGRALLFSLLCLTLPVLAFMGQEARMYTWAAFFVGAAFLSGEAVCRRMQAGQGCGKLVWIALGLSSLAAAWTHYYALIAVVWVWVLLLVRLLGARKSGTAKGFFLPALVCAGLCILLYLPWLQAVLFQSGRVARKYWIGPVSPGTIMSILVNPWSPASFNLATVLAAPLSWGLMLGFPVVAGFRKLTARLRPLRPLRPSPPADTGPGPSTLAIPLPASPSPSAPDAGFACRALLVFALTLATGIVVSLLFRPVLIERYLVPCAGLLVLALTAALASLPRKSMVVTLTVLLCALNALPLADMHTKRFKGAMTEAVADLKSRVWPDDVFVHPTELNLGPFSWYYPAQRHYLWVPEGFVPFSNYDVFGHNSRWGNDPTPWIGQPDRIWLTWLPWEKPDFNRLPFLAGYRLETGREYRIPDSWYAPAAGLFVKDKARD